MKPTVRLCLVLHNHQPIGNFEHVFEQAYDESYLPFLQVFEPFENLNISLHISGPLAQWLDAHHSDYMDRIKQLVLAGRVEIIGGGFYEPILPMLPSRDRIGQITNYTDWLQNRFDAKVQGMWVAERVWESSLASDIAKADIQYTVLDDFHFRHAGLTDDQLHGHYITEDDGRTLKVFPGSERLRYLIPFADPQETIDCLRDLAHRCPGTIAVFGDDGEKFGTWPETHKHVYQDGWLKRFLEALDENRDWLITSTLADAVESQPPRGKIFLPDASYREMTEWALPVSRQLEYDHLKHDLDAATQADDSKLHPQTAEQVKSFVRGGLWRNFKVRYPDTNDMYARMMYVSSLLQQAEQEHVDATALTTARDHLYRGQCNCPYWHGAFGGMYLPHLRNAIYSELIQAENILHAAIGKTGRWCEATADDYNFDGRPEIRLANPHLVAWVSPATGGSVYELDVRSIRHNLLATIDRAPEAYHEKVRRGQGTNSDEAASIHDRVIFKQDGLDQRLQYDSHRRKMLIDHFWDAEVSLDQIVSGQASERGDFSTGAYQSKIRRAADRVQIQLSRAGNAWGVPLQITKAVTLSSDDSNLEVVYLLAGLPQDREFHFAVEFNFAGLPSGADDRFFHFGDGASVGQLQTRLDTDETPELHLADQWLGIDVGLNLSQPSRIWAFPIESVSQSEAGFELVHQSVVVQPHWLVRGDTAGQWSVKMDININTSQGESQKKQNDSHVTATS